MSLCWQLRCLLSEGQHIGFLWVISLVYVCSGSHLRMSDPASGIVGQVTADVRRITAEALSEWSDRHLPSPVRGLPSAVGIAERSP